MSPVYEYRCKSCDYEFEIKQRYESPVDMRCPNCDGKGERKMSIVYNSFGWTFSENFYKIKGYPHELVRNV